MWEPTSPKKGGCNRALILDNASVDKHVERTCPAGTKKIIQAGGLGDCPDFVLWSLCVCIYIYINDCRYQVSLPHLLSYSDLFRTVKAWNPRWLWWRCSPAGGWEALHCGVWQVRAGTLLTNMTSSWKWYEPIIESFQVLGEIFTEVTSYFRVLSWLPRTLKRFWKTLSIRPHGAKSRLKLDFISNIPVKVAKKIPNIQWGSIGSRAKGSEDRSVQGGLLQVA